MTQQSLPTVGEYMTESLATIEAGMSAGDALERMYMDNIRHLPVVDERGALIGLVSTRDLAVASALRGADAYAARVDVFMTPAPFSCPADSPLLSIVERMEHDRIGSAVVTRGGRPCGIFTTTDALRALRSQLLGHKVEPLIHPAVAPETSTSHGHPSFPHVQGVRGPKPSDAMVSWLFARLM